MSTAYKELQPINEASRIRELEEREISALASHVEPANDLRFQDIFCHECDDNLTIAGSPRELAEKANRLDWMVCQGNVLCRACQDR
jgi:hypothetical protein